MRACRVEVAALDGVHTGARLGIPHAQGAVTLAATCHHGAAVWSELSARQWTAVACEHLHSTQYHLLPAHPSDTLLWLLACEHGQRIRKLPCRPDSQELAFL